MGLRGSLPYPCYEGSHETIYTRPPLPPRAGPGTPRAGTAIPLRTFAPTLSALLGPDRKRALNAR